MRKPLFIAMATLAGAIVLCAALLASARPTDWALTAILAALSFGLSQASVQLRPGVSFLLDTSVVAAAFLLQGPLAAAITMLCSVSLSVYITQRTSLVTIVFNSAQEFLSAGLAGVLIPATWQGGFALTSFTYSAGSAVQLALAAITFVVCMHFINVFLLSAYAAAQERVSVVSVLRDINPLSDLPSSIVLALVGVLLASLIASKSWIGVLLLAVPVLAVRKLFRIYTEMAEAYSDTVGALIGALEEKDTYTRGHSDRVARYCRLIAQELGLAARDMVLLERAALLHDIGKMGVPETVLRSPNTLSSEETHMVREHPAMGAQVLDGIDFLETVLPLVRGHHERLDGSGYPDGVSAAQLPLLARIIAVADAFDAMTSDRPYRARLPVSQAIAELQRESGARFDSAAVSALLRALRRTEAGERLSSGSLDASAAGSAGSDERASSTARGER